MESKSNCAIFNFGAVIIAIFVVTIIILSSQISEISRQFETQKEFMRDSRKTLNEIKHDIKMEFESNRIFIKNFDNCEQVRYESLFNLIKEVHTCSETRYKTLYEVGRVLYNNTTTGDLIPPTQEY